MSEGELYGIELDPLNPDLGVPGGATPNGSIGGSDVGANERDDQRVRDLVQQYLEEATTISWLNNLNLGSDALIEEYYNSDEVILASFAPSGTTGVTVTGQTRTISLPGGSIRAVLAGTVAIEYIPLVAAATAQGADVNAALYIDGSLVHVETLMARNTFFTLNTQSIYDLSASRADIILEPGVQHKYVSEATTDTLTAAEMTTLLTEGSHTFRVDLICGWNDDTRVELRLLNEYIAFYNCDDDKATKLAVYDSATVI